MDEITDVQDPKRTSLFFLRDTVETQRELAEQEETFVRRAREAGASWKDIGDVYGVSRQAAHARWAVKERVWNQ